MAAGFLSNQGSVEDIRCSIRCAQDNGKIFTLDELKVELIFEKEHQNRATVIKILESKINRLCKSKGTSR